MNAVAKVDQDNVDAAPLAAVPLPAAPTAAEPARKRRPLRLLLMVSLPLALAAGGSYVWITGGRYQETENANVRQSKVSIASDAEGRIIEVDIAENKPVKRGEVLFRIDPEPYRIALAQADAAVAAARLGVEQLRASYSQAVAQERMAAGEVEYLQTQFDRQTELARKGINTKSSLDEASHDLAKAKDQQLAAIQGIASARAAIGGDPDIATDKHPSVMAAQAARDKAAWILAQTTVTAPADGVISQSTAFKAGQYVTSGTPLFSLVENRDTWVEANFKETQLTNMMAGQLAEIVLDTYPDHPFKAVVESIGAGTGSEFSLLPAQNATGNWVKVTQRIPVRLKVEGTDPAIDLRTGMSASVSIDTGVSRGLASLFGSAHAGQ